MWRENQNLHLSRNSPESIWNPRENNCGYFLILLPILFHRGSNILYSENLSECHHNKRCARECLVLCSWHHCLLQSPRLGQKPQVFLTWVHARLCHDNLHRTCRWRLFYYWLDQLRTLVAGHSLPDQSRFQQGLGHDWVQFLLLWRHWHCDADIWKHEIHRQLPCNIDPMHYDPRVAILRVWNFVLPILWSHGWEQVVCDTEPGRE